MKTYVVVKTSFVAFHCWPTCPFDEVSFLKNLHRHVFFVTVKWETTIDRQLEFFVQKKKIDDNLNNLRNKDLGFLSCEMIAQQLLYVHNADYVSVFEDNENGSEVIK